MGHDCDVGVVEVAYATPRQQIIVEVTFEPGMNARQAVMAAELPTQVSGLTHEAALAAPLGVFGEHLKVPEHYYPAPGERIEVYRALEIDPMQARRERAARRKS